MFTTFEDIEAWQEARALANACRVFLHRARKQHDYGWADQLSNALLSVMANIAEGNDAKTNAEFVGFLGYAKRSTAECRSHFYFGLDAGYIQKDELDDVMKRAKKIGAQLARLMSYLHSAPDKKMRMATTS